MRFCVFAGSSPGRRAVYGEAARALGAELAHRGIGLVYGGASVGLMGAAANGALEAGGEVIGVIPRLLADVELAHPGLTELHVVESMHQRKALMAELSEAFVVLPGGLGSLEEAFEVWTWNQLGIHRKAIGLLNVEGFYSGLERFLDSLVEERFVKPEHRGILVMAEAPAELVDRLLACELPEVGKWFAQKR